MVTETTDGNSFPEFSPTVPCHQRGHNGFQGNSVQGIAGVGLRF
jgi:hypothetical protein